MKNFLLSIALLLAINAWGQNTYVWTTINFSHRLVQGVVYLDSISVRSQCSYSVDSVVYYFSGWTSTCNIPFYYLYSGSQPAANSTTAFNITPAYLDSCKGHVVYSWSYYGIYSGNLACGIDAPNSFGIDICDTWATPPTAITRPIQTTKTGIVTIYDAQGRFVKTSQVANYTEGLNPGQLYIYNTIYSDGSVDKGKFVIE